MNKECMQLLLQGIKFGIIGCVFLCILYIVHLIGVSTDSGRQIEEKVKSGEWELQCYFREDGWKTVDPKKVVGLNPNGVTWEFTNGFASNCEIYK